MFSITTRVRYQETDHAGRVYHSNYLIWLDMTRTEFLRHNRIDYAKMEREGIYMVVKKASLEYFKSPFYDDIVKIAIEKIEVSGVRVDFYYDIVDNKTDVLLVKAFTQLVCVNNQGKPIKIPNQISRVIK